MSAVRILTIIVFLGSALADLDPNDCTEPPLDKLLQGPANESDAPSWRARMHQFRKTCRKAYPFTSTALDEPDLQWTQTSYVQTQMHPFDRYFYDDELGKYTVTRFLDDLSNRYGGIDAMLFWPSYTNLGLDDRNQFDMMRALPGGTSRLKELVTELKGSDVRVLVPYNPWDSGTRREGTSDADALAQLIADLGADGFNGDTMNFVGEEFYDAGVSRGLKLAIEPEQAGTPTMANYTVLHWAYWGQPPPAIKVIKDILEHVEHFDLDLVWETLGSDEAFLEKVPGVEFFKWTNDARHMTHACERYASNKTDYLQVAFFNGIGFESWENVWGIWNQMTERDSEALRRSASILRFFGKHWYLQSQDWQPHTSVKQPSDAIFVSEFPRAAYDRVFLAVNRVGRLASTNLRLQRPPANVHMTYYDCYAGRVIRAAGMGATVEVPLVVDASGFGCILATKDPPTDLNEFLHTMARITSVPLSSYSTERVVLKQTMVKHEYAPGIFAAQPEGMVEVPATLLYNFKVSGIEIEPFSTQLFPKLADLPNWVFPVLAGRVPVDVQFPWEAQPTKYHEKIMHVSRFFLDKHPVSVQDYAAYLAKSGYKPLDGYNWLKNWNHSTSPPSPPQGRPPVTYVSLREARDYCAFHGKRLPHDWEWQYAAQGHDGRQYPWGHSDLSSMHPKVVHKAPIPQAEDIGSYPQAASPFGVQDLVGHVWQFTDEFYDNHTRAVLVRGGSYYKPNQSSWYFPDAAHLQMHGKYFLMSDSFERAGTLGFRCAADSSIADQALVV